MALTPLRFMVPLALLQLLCFFVLTSSSAGGSAPDNDQHDLLMLDRFHRWMAFHDRSYPNDDEKLRRFEVYRHNVEYIERTNRDGGLGYQLGENDFTDLTSEEFAARYIGGLIANNDSKVISEGYVADVGKNDPSKLKIPPPPKKVDWRKKHAVTPAKNQGKCGSCWAFAAVATVESAHYIANGKLLNLSEQEILDCDRNDQYGCEGGFPDRALQWIWDYDGIMTEDSYGPYVGEQQACDLSRRAYNYLVTIESVWSIPASEEALKLAVSRQPVAVTIEANVNMQFYNNTSGIYTGPCATLVNHAVVVVGYGRDAVSGVDYWIVKNSWGSKWGHNGFFLMRRGADGPRGLCGIVSTQGVYPLASVIL